MAGIVQAHVLVDLVHRVLPAPVRSSAIVLILANLLPLYGVAAWDWPVFHLMALYWAENVIAGVYTVMRMVAASPLAGIPLGAFFCIHYGLFCFVHGVFVLALFSGRVTGHTDPAALVEVLLTTPQLAWGVGLLVFSHGWSYVASIHNGELAGGAAVVQRIMMRPYARMVLLHVTILVGGFLAAAAADPTPALVVIVALKLVADVKLHVRAHLPRPAAEPAPGTEVP